MGTRWDTEEQVERIAWKVRPPLRPERQERRHAL